VIEALENRGLDKMETGEAESVTPKLYSPIGVEMSQSRIKEVFRFTTSNHGTRAITGDTALRLAHFFGTSAQFWLNLQSLYDLRLAQEKVGKSIKALPTLKRRELVHA
jgi:addiction module HigA family antidote